MALLTFVGLCSKMGLFDDICASLFEFAGTTLFLLLGLGGIQSALDASPQPSVATVLYIATCMGLSLLISVWLFFRISGGVYNPNITLSLFLIGAISPIRFVLYTVAQIVGGITASGLLVALLPGPKVAADLKYIVLI
jgi:aquaporin related protein